MSADSQPLVAIIDYGMGNRRSVEKALEHVGVRALITAEHETLARADALVLPGVGAFPRGMSNLRAAGLDGLVCQQVSAGTPLLGICLGMQLLFDSSSELEVETPGLGLIGGRVRRLQANGLRVPHIGWNEVRFERESELTRGLPGTGVPFYHVHSYVAAEVDPEDVVGSAEYGERFPTIVQRADVYGAQFHPEKSSLHGLQLLSAFAQIARDRGRHAELRA